MTSQYNDIIVNGQVTSKGSRPSELRYKAIKEHCKNYNRPFSVLDIGAAEGYFTHMLANEFSGIFTAVESDPGRQLLDTCVKNNNKQVILLEKRLNLQGLIELGEVHYYDVILALNVIHHFDEPFNEVLKAIMKMCSYCFLEHPDPNEGPNTKNFHRIMAEKLDTSGYDALPLLSTGAEHLGYGEIKRQMFLLSNKNEITLQRHYQNGRFFEQGEGIEIHASFDKINMSYQHKKEQRDCHLGLKLRSFFLNSGSYPTLTDIVNLLDNCDISEDNARADLSCHNSIIDNDKIILIDQDDSNHDTGKYFYISTRRMLIASIFLTYPVTVPADLFNRFVKIFVHTQNGPVLSLVALEGNKLQVYSTLKDSHSMIFQEINIH